MKRYSGGPQGMRENEMGPWVEYEDMRNLFKIRNAAMALLVCLDRKRPDQTLMAMAVLRDALRDDSVSKGDEEK